MLVSPTSAIQHLDEEVPDELADLVVRKSADPSNTDFSTTSDDYPESLDSSTGEEISHLKQVKTALQCCMVGEGLTHSSHTSSEDPGSAMTLLASFPGRSHFQYLIACSMQIQRGQAWRFGHVWLGVIVLTQLLYQKWFLQYL